MPRFSIKDLMLAMLLVSLGLATEIAIFSGHLPGPIGLLAYFCGLAMIGAGLFAPFHKKVLGAWFFVGVGVAAIVFMLPSVD